LANKYTNPRIDFPNQGGDALNGEVALDIVKTVWVLSMFGFGVIGSLLTISIDAVMLFIVFTAITLCLGHSLGMHRRFIHRSYQCPKALEVFFVHLGTIVGLAGPMGMLRTHDLRDWAQRQPRCHDYFSHGSLWYKDLYWQLLCSIKLDRPPKFEPEAAIANDWIYQWMERTWMLQQIPWAILFYMLGGWPWVFWGICSRVTVSIIGHWLIGYFAHNTGDRRWHVDGAAVQGHNVAWVSLLTMGESWHNNHHAFPYSSKLGIENGQCDPGWWVLTLLQRIGLVSDLVLPDEEKSRTDLICIDCSKVAQS